MPAKSKKDKRGKGAQNILLLVKLKGNYYAAAPTWKLPSAYTKQIDAYEVRAGGGVSLSSRALAVALDQVEMTPQEWIAYNLKNPIPGPPPR